MHVRDLFDLSGQVAIVTGGSRGLGLQMATGLAEAGAAVVITARKPDALESAAARLRDQGFRALPIVCVAGIVGADPRVMDAIGYSASKGAVIAFTRDLAVKWAPHGITVNAIAPGFFPTKMTRWLIEHRGTAILNTIPMGRFGGEDDLKGAAVFLASQASAFVTGQVLVVDGGATAW